MKAKLNPIVHRRNLIQENIIRVGQEQNFKKIYLTEEEKVEKGKYRPHKDYGNVPSYLYKFR